MKTTLCILVILALYSLTIVVADSKTDMADKGKKIGKVAEENALAEEADDSDKVKKAAEAAKDNVRSESDDSDDDNDDKGMMKEMFDIPKNAMNEGVKMAKGFGGMFMN